MQNLELIISELTNAVDVRHPLHPIFDGVFVRSKRPGTISRNPSYSASLLHARNIVSIEKALSFDSLESELNAINALTAEAKTNTLFYLVQKYTWRFGVPGKGDLQDVAYCDAKRVEYVLENKEGGGYLLLKGDLSGIQPYIYGGLKPKVTGALGDLSKKLRGRSTIVSLLTEFLAKVILKELNLPIWHLLFAGGGHFNLLLPKAKKGELLVLSEKLDKEMRRWFGDRLSLILAWVEADSSIQNKAGEYFQLVNEEKEKKKYKQHDKYLEGHFFLPDKQAKPEIEALEVGIGDAFPKRKLLAFVVSKNGLRTNKQTMTALDFEMHGNRYQLLLVKGKSKKKAISNASNLLIAKNEYDSAQLLFINDTGFVPSNEVWDYEHNEKVGFGFVFLGRYAPKNDDTDKIKDFEELCFHQNEAGTLTNEQMKKGFLRLAALRLDVDDLGYIFSKGLGDNATLGQIACLSREMHYFFTVHLDWRAQEHEVYVIYSGGDDAFVVGRWDKVIEFVSTIETDFKSYTQNKDIHFSAGIFMGDPKYPVGRFYRDAGRLQGEAKSRFAKNQVSVYDHVMEWQSFSSKIDLGKGFVKILSKEEVQSKKKFTRAFANRVLRLVKSSFYERNGKDENGEPMRRKSMNVQQFSRNIASMRYLFARHGFSNDKLVEMMTKDVEKELTIDFLKSFDHDAIGKPSKGKQIRDYLVAFNYALFTLRSKEKSSKS